GHGARSHTPPVPTRRSSDLPKAMPTLPAGRANRSPRFIRKSAMVSVVREVRRRSMRIASAAACELGEQSPQLMVSTQPPLNGLRSEEHTSELQSRENLVCRL